MSDASVVLTLNVGSSSLKFALFRIGGVHQRLLSGQFDRVGRPDTSFRLVHATGATGSEALGQLGHGAAAGYLFDHLRENIDLATLAAIGHRIVHGGARYRHPALIGSEMIDALKVIAAYAPEHLPPAIEVIARCRERFAAIPQIACFDTAFHQGMPAVARILPIPRRFLDKGVQRYGFHGLSYSYLLDELERQAGAEVARGRLVLAHLGSGASLAAVHNRQGIDTSMGFTPAGGIPMGTRSGDLDPGLVHYLAQTEGMDALTFDRMTNHESGLLGVSETSADLRDLLAREADDVRAADAVALFCYRAKQTIGAFAATLGGLDQLVFTGGVGENAPAIRERICAGLGFLGIALDRDRNARSATTISASGSRVGVHVIPADEEAVIVKAVAAMLDEQETSP